MKTGVSNLDLTAKSRFRTPAVSQFMLNHYPACWKWAEGGDVSHELKKITLSNAKCKDVNRNVNVLRIVL